MDTFHLKKESVFHAENEEPVTEERALHLSRDRLRRLRAAELREVFRRHLVPAAKILKHARVAART